VMTPLCVRPRTSAKYGGFPTKVTRTSTEIRPVAGARHLRSPRTLHRQWAVGAGHEPGLPADVEGMNMGLLLLAFNQDLNNNGDAELHKLAAPTTRSPRVRRPRRRGPASSGRSTAQRLEDSTTRCRIKICAVSHPQPIAKGDEGPAIRDTTTPCSSSSMCCLVINLQRGTPREG